jgi:hypothetical protein
LNPTWEQRDENGVPISPRWKVQGSEGTEPLCLLDPGAEDVCGKLPKSGGVPQGRPACNDLAVPEAPAGTGLLDGIELDHRHVVALFGDVDCVMARHSVLALAAAQGQNRDSAAQFAVPARETALQRSNKVPLAWFQLRLPSTPETLISHQQFGDLVSFGATAGPSGSGARVCHE